MRRKKKLFPVWIVLGLIIIICVGIAVLISVPGEQEESTSSSEIASGTSSAESVSSGGQLPENRIPAAWNDNGIFADSYEKAYDRLEQMTLEEKIGQLLLVRCPLGDAAKTARQYHLGGYVLFGRDFDGKSREEVRQKILSCQEASDIPMLMAVDEEGGSIVRISSNSQLADHRFRSPQDLYQSGGLDAIRADASEKAALLKELGLNLNLAPVADVSTDPADYIYARTLGKPAEETAAYVSSVVETNQKAGISSALKHFPGYGTNVDTHTGISIDKREYSVFQNTDFLPFQAGIDSGVETILVSHNIVTCMDEDRPASLSPEVHRILREELHYTGLIMTDDLAMEAIASYSGEDTPAVAAVLAGNDLLITTDYQSAYDSLKRAAEEGRVSQNQIDHAVFRILAMKYHTGIL